MRKCEDCPALQRAGFMGVQICLLKRKKNRFGERESFVPADNTLCTVTTRRINRWLNKMEKEKEQQLQQQELEKN